jgi:urease accessory protein
MLIILILFLNVLFPVVVFAHESSLGGLISGLNHPVLGLDHLLAMVSVGIISYQLSGKAIWG